MEIGNRIRELRKNKGITQEQLAGRLGISFQAVSKWENNIALPDIIMIPILADFFEVSTDDLFDYRKEKIREEVDKICQDAIPFREKDPAVARRILEAGLEKYVDNYQLTNHLLYVMNLQENPDEVIEMAGRLVAECQDYEIKYDALRFLAYAYKEKGKQEDAEAAIEQIPQMCFTKLSETAFIKEGKKRYEAALRQKWISLEIALQMFIKIVEYFVEEGNTKEAILEVNRAIWIIKILKIEEQTENLKVYENYLRKMQKQLKLL